MIKYQKIQNPKAWLYRVGANLCNNHVKRAIKLRIIYEKTYELDISPGNTEDDFIRSEEILRIRQALKKLRDKERTLLLLHQDGLSHAEIADVIKIRTGSVSKLLSRSLDKLSRILNDEGYFNESD